MPLVAAGRYGLWRGDNGLLPRMASRRATIGYCGAPVASSSGKPARASPPRCYCHVRTAVGGTHARAGPVGAPPRRRGAARELAARYPTLILVHLPTRASWLNQSELYFSIIQRKVLTPNDFASLGAVEVRLLACETLYNRTAHPYAWMFTRTDLERRLAQLTLIGKCSPPLISQSDPLRARTAGGNAGT